MSQRPRALRKVTQSLVLRLEQPEWKQVSAGLAKGIWLNVRPNLDSVYILGDPEKEVSDALKQCLEPGACFYDVGAHIGFYSFAAAKLVGETGSVYSFEADPANCESLRMNMMRNPTVRVHLVEAAVTNCGQKSVQFERLDASRMGGKVAAHETVMSGSLLKVRAQCLDDFVDEGHRKPDLIKIDVEGGELEVLQGARNLLKQSNPRVVCEIHGAELADRVTVLFDFNHFACRWLGSQDSYPRHLLAEPKSYS